MRNIQSGFAPLLIVLLIAVLAIGGGAYVYTQGGLSAETRIPTDIEEGSGGVVTLPATTTVQRVPAEEPTTIPPVVKKVPIAVPIEIQTTGTLKLDFATYRVGCMITGCQPNYTPTSVQHLTLKNGDTFGTAPGYEKGTLFELVSSDESKVTVKLASFVSPLVKHTRIKVGSDATFSFSTSACFALNNWMDDVPSFCLARSSAATDLDFDVISEVAP